MKKNKEIMKKYILCLIIICSATPIVKAQDFVIANFEGSQQIYTTTSGGGPASGSSAVVTEDPAGGDNHALRVLVKKSNTYPEFKIDLPEGKKVGDYKGISMDIFRVDKGTGSNIQFYLGNWEEGKAPDRWGNNGTLKYNTNRDQDLGSHEWKTIVILFSQCTASNSNGLLSSDLSLNKLRILIGIGSGDVRYFINNLKFIK